VNDANGNISSDTTLRPRLDAVETMNTTQNTRITGAETRLTAIEAVNTSQATAITNLQNTQTTQAGQITAIQGVNTTQTTQINSLFDLTETNRLDIRKANEGVAMALAMETPQLPGDARFGVSGGVGYFQNRLAGTAAMAARIGTMASFSAGVGVGLDSGEIGARAGFSAAW
jgi:hypothetical protein